VSRIREHDEMSENERDHATHRAANGSAAVQRPGEDYSASESQPVAKLQSGTYLVPAERQRVDLQALCAEAVRVVTYRATERGLTLDVTQFAKEAYVNHRAGLRFVLVELLQHAIEEAALGSTITLLTTPRKNSTEIRIIDWRNGEERPSRAVGSGAEWGTLPEKLLELRRVLTGRPSSGCIRVEQAQRARGICIRLPSDR
jgi:hypothetical protein